MANTIDNAYIRTFEANVRHLAQQGDTRLRRWVTEGHKNSESHVWETLDSVAASEKLSRLAATPVVDAPWATRMTTIRTYHIGEATEQEDIAQMLVDPNSALAHAIALAMKRQVDDVIIAEADAAAVDKDGTSIAYDTTNQLVGDGSGEITLDVVLQVQEIFDNNDIDPDIPKVFVIGPTQKRKLMQLMEVTSADYQSMKALATGYLPSFLGFDWVVSNRLQVPDTDEIDCLAFTKRAMGLHVAKDIWVRIAEDPSVSFAWRIYSAMSMDAVRVEDKHMVRVHLADTIS
jgi:hypothetical protein